MFGIEAKHFFQISNLLSLFRLVGAFPLFWLLYDETVLAKPYVLVIVFLLSISDFFDGYLARKLNQVSELGKILDPLADKVMVIAVAIAFFTTGILDKTLFLVIVLRDLMIILPGIFLSKYFGSVPASDQIGKWTFTFIGSYLILIYVGADKSSIPMMVYYYGLIALIFTSYINYAIRAYKTIKNKI